MNEIKNQSTQPKLSAFSRKINIGDIDIANYLIWRIL